MMFGCEAERETQTEAGREGMKEVQADNRERRKQTRSMHSLLLQEQEPEKERKRKTRKWRRESLKEPLAETCCLRRC